MHYQERENDLQGIQLAFDRSQGQIKDNQEKSRLATSEFIAKAQDWGTPGDEAVEWSEIIENLIKKGGGRWLGAKSSIYRHHELDQIIDQICMIASIIPDGWEEPITAQEQVEVLCYDKGDEVDIEVMLWR